MNYHSLIPGLCSGPQQLVQLFVRESFESLLRGDPGHLEISRIVLRFVSTAVDGADQKVERLLEAHILCIMVRQVLFDLFGVGAYRPCKYFLVGPEGSVEKRCGPLLSIPPTRRPMPSGLEPPSEE